MRRCLYLLFPLFMSQSIYADDSYRICVSGNAIPACNDLVKEGSTQGLKLTCLPVRDRVECLKKIMNNEADVSPVEPEDMFVAAQMSNQNFRIIKEIRGKNDLSEEHRYQAVAVIHEGLHINKIQDLKGRNSCHTGVGRTVGYKIPVTKLSKLGVIEPLTSSDDASPREHELRAMSRAFDRACIVGPWAPDDETNRNLKAAYPNLCALCEFPSKCDYPDKYSGYEGALKCVTEGGGDIAWTKVDAVKSFFGLNPGTSAQADASKFSYLCPDATRRPVTGAPCSWAARPWLGYITRTNVANVAELQRQITLAESISNKAQAVLGITDKTTTVNREPISPQDFLSKSSYTDVIEREVGTTSPLRICTRSVVEHHKCEDFASVSFSRDVRPHLSCIKRDSGYDCMKALQNSEADVVTLDAEDAYIASRKYGLHSVMSENVTGSEADYYVVAVIKSNSNINSLEDLRGKKSCHPEINDLKGWNIPLATLMDKGLIDELRIQESSVNAAASEFFSGGSCAPGALTSPGNPLSLCALCATTQAGLYTMLGAEPCPANEKEDFYGEKGAVLCLASGKGDVAFMRPSTITRNADGASDESWASGLKKEDYKLLCADGGTAAVSEYKSCYLTQIPPRSLVISNYANDGRTESIRMAFLSASKSFTKPNTNIFQMFGTYKNQHNVMFTNNAVGLQILDPEFPLQSKFTALLDRFKAASEN